MSQGEARVQLPMLEAGQQMDQPTFHARYLAMPEDAKFELIGGTVHMASPVSGLHGEPHSMLDAWLYLYSIVTPGTKSGNNMTAVLGVFSEPQPDLHLRLLPTHGGTARLNGKHYIEGPPELVAEVSVTTEALDLRDKRLDYDRYGVSEYLVYAVSRRKIYWWTRGEEGFVPLLSDEAGIFRSRIFPGLWLSEPAVLAEDGSEVIATLQRGLASAEHAEFVTALQARKETQP
jgi:Uma2 family endonuclease